MFLRKIGYWSGGGGNLKMFGLLNTSEIVFLLQKLS